MGIHGAAGPARRTIGVITSAALVAGAVLTGSTPAIAAAGSPASTAVSAGLPHGADPGVPLVGSVDYPAAATGGGPGIPGAFTLRSATAGVVRYTYRFTNPDGATPERSIRAAADGTATLRWTPTDHPDTWGGWYTLEVRSHGADGGVSDRAYYRFQVNALAPRVTSAPGETYTFTFHNVLAGAVRFEYAIDDAAPASIPVRPDGTAELRWTPTSAHGHSLTVRSRTRTGVTSGWSFRSLWIS
jgi:hypothetical protein